MDKLMNTPNKYIIRSSAMYVSSQDYFENLNPECEIVTQ